MDGNKKMDGKDVLTLDMLKTAKEALKQPIDLSDDPYRREYYEFLKKGPNQ